MNISLIGSGLMGQALGGHLLDLNHSLTVFNRSIEKVGALQGQGARISPTAQAALVQSNFCLLMLSDATAINQVLDSIDPSSMKDRLFIQLGTIAPSESRSLAERIRLNQGRYLECPVLGSLPEARTGTLILMAGGDRQDYDLALPLLNLIGTEPKYIGPVGQGATVKLAMNQLIAGLTASFSLSLALIEKEGIDTDTFMAIVRDSALYAPTFDKKLDRMLTADFSKPNFPTKHLAKDVELFSQVAQQLNLDTAALDGIATLLTKALAQGLADTDYSALYAAINEK